MSKKTIWNMVGIVTLLVVAVLTFYIPHQNKTTNTKEEPITIRIGYREQDNYSPLFVGIEKEIFTKYNLKIEPIKFESSNQLMEALLANRIDASLGGVNTFSIFMIEDKSPGAIKLFTVMTESQDRPCSYLIVKKDSKISSVKDLNNKKIGSHLGSAVKIIYNSIVKSNDLKNTSLLQMEPNLELQALESGQIDAGIVLEPLSTIGSYKNISHPIEKGLFDKYILNNLPLAGSIVSINFTNKHPELTKRLITATDEAIQYIRTNENEAKNILPKYTPLEEKVTQNIILPNFLKSTEIDINELQKLSDFLLKEKEIKNPINAQNVILHLP